jgi:hypothetical protein
LKKSPTGPAFTKGPLKNKTGITSNNKGFTFMADNSMNRLICLRWIFKAQRKENFLKRTSTRAISKSYKHHFFSAGCASVGAVSFGAGEATIFSKRGH